jgi:hypothetical protein
MMLGLLGLLGLLKLLGLVGMLRATPVNVRLFAGVRVAAAAARPFAAGHIFLDKMRWMRSMRFKDWPSP